LVAELSVNGGAPHDMQHSGPERVLRRDRAGGVIHEYRLMAQVSAPASGDEVLRVCSTGVAFTRRISFVDARSLLFEGIG
jgi:hypothetical protein